MGVAEIISGVLGPDADVRIIGYDGSKAGPDSADGVLRIVSPRALARLVTARARWGWRGPTSPASWTSTATCTRCWPRCRR
jgi:hypothetical protein